MQVTPNEQLQIQPQGFAGLRIQDPILARLTKKVLMVSCISAVLVVASNVALYMEGYVDTAAFGKGTKLSDKEEARIATTAFSIGLGLIVPLCGYLGARWSSQNWSCCFCGCNLLLCCFSLLSIVLLSVVYATLSLIKNDCDPAQPDLDSHCPSNTDWQKFPKCKEDSLSPEECYHNTVDDLEKFSKIFGVVMIFLICSCVLQCLSFHWGRQLHARLKEGVILHAPNWNNAGQQYPLVQYPVQPAASNQGNYLSNLMALPVQSAGNQRNA